MTTIRDVIDGDWVVEDRCRVGLSNPGGPDPLGTLRIKSDRYEFHSSPGVAIPDAYRRYVPFLHKTSGKLTVTLSCGSLDTALSQLRVEGHRTNSLLARLDFFEHQTTQTHQFFITVNDNLGLAELHPDYHAMLETNPCSVTKRLLSLGT